MMGGKIMGGEIRIELIIAIVLLLIPLSSASSGNTTTILTTLSDSNALNYTATLGTESGLSNANLTTYGKGYRFDKNGWIYVHIEGEPYQRGYQHGYLVAPEIKEIMRSLRYLSYWNTGMNWSFFVDAGERIFKSKIDPEYLDEIKGIADGANAQGVDVTWQEILAWNVYYELFYRWWPNEKENLSLANNRQEKHHCSALIASGNATKDGKIVIGHNTWESYELAQFSNEILDIKPDRGHHILMQSLPGYIYSHTDFFMNDAGLTGTETAISGMSKFDLNGISDSFRARKAMQYSDDIEQFTKIMLDGNNGGSADSWLLGDTKTGEIARLELGLKYYNLTKTKNGYFIGFNAPTDPKIRNLECTYTGYSDIRRHQGARQVRLTQLMDQYYGKLNVEIVKSILVDHYDVYLQKVNPDSRTIDGHYELDPMDYTSDLEGPLPYQPEGTVDGTTADSDMVRNLSFFARWGNSAGIPFKATEFLSEHPQWSYLKGYLNDRPNQPWTQFQAGERLSKQS
jgi:hypothetical protein